MEFIKTDIEGLILVKPKVFTDNRGFFLESYAVSKFKEGGIDCAFVQDNHSLSINAGVIRGLHFQTEPCSQAKLIRVIKGSIFDVAVDLRRGSPTFGQWRGFTLSAANFDMLFIPRGFAHGFCTLEDNSEIAYKADNLYSAQHDGGIIWNDPDIGIEWPTKNPILSAKDANLPKMKEIF